MRGLRNFLPLLLLAMATRAIPLPEPRSIPIVSAHDAAVESDGVHDGAFDKREIRGDLDTAEAETESVTALPVETEEPQADGVSSAEPEEEMESPEEETEQDDDTDETMATERPEDDDDEEVKAEDEMDHLPTEDESKKEEEHPTTEEAKEDKAEPDQGNEKMSGNVPEEEKVDGRIGEVDNHDNSEEGTATDGPEEDPAGLPPVAPEEDPLYPIGHPVQNGNFPWPFPLPLDLPVDGFPDHPVQQVGNEVQPQPKVIFPIYLISIDPRYLGL